MKKILLGTTTLAASLFAGAAFADTPKVTVGGYANFEVGMVNDDLDDLSTKAGSAAQRTQAFRNDTIVAFKIDGKSDAGLGYGGEINILADTSADVQGRGVNASKTMVYLENMWGRVELGSNVGAENTMKVDAATIARATGGINGDWTYFANASDQFLAQGALPLQYGAIGSNVANGANTTNYLGQRTEENLNKVTYYTPRFAGFQLGVSYLPDQSNRGQGTNGQAVPGPNRSSDNAGLSQNIFTGGLSYDNKGVALAATGVHGNSQLSQYEDLAAWNVGGKLSYMGFSLAGGYGDWGRSNTLKSVNSKNTDYWNVGAAYEYGPFGASVTYLNSTFDCGTAAGGAGTGPTGDCQVAGKHDFDSLSVGADYKLAPGLTPYAEVTWYDMNPNGTTRDNSGYVGIVGTQLNF